MSEGKPNHKARTSKVKTDTGRQAKKANNDELQRMKMTKSTGKSDKGR